MTRLPLILAAGALVVGPALAATKSEHKFSLTFSSKSPGTPTAVSFLTDRTGYKAPAPGTPAERVKTTTFIMAPGTRTNVAAYPKCSKAIIEAKTSKGCPAGSKVGTGKAYVVLGTPQPVVLTAKMFAATHGLVVSLEGAQNQVIGMTISGNRIVAQVPRKCFPESCTGPYLEAVLKKLTVHLNKGKLITTPPTCPKSGAWTNTVIYKYVNGDTERKTSSSPCK